MAILVRKLVKRDLHVASSTAITLSCIACVFTTAILYVKDLRLMYTNLCSLYETIKIYLHLLLLHCHIDRQIIQKQNNGCERLININGVTESDI